MEKIKLKAVKREALGKKVRALRRDGSIPAVLYGKDKDNINLSVSQKEFDAVYKKSGGNTLVFLDIDGEDGKNVLINQVEKHPVSGNVIHADFHAIKMSEKITATVPLKFIGDSKAVIDLGGSLITNKSEVEVECLPAELPHEIEIDVTSLEDFDKTIHVSDIRLAEGIAIKDDPEETITHVEPPRSEEEMEELEEPIEDVEMPEAEKGEPEEGEEEGESEGKKEEGIQEKGEDKEKPEDKE